MARLSTTVIEQLGWYVYLYIDPCGEQEEVFYVGKGQGNRVLNHLTGTHNKEMSKRIKAIRSKGYDPAIDILAYDLNEKEAFIVEAAAIDLFGVENLTNQQSGQESHDFGRISLDELVRIYDAEEADITDPVLLIRINKLFEYDMLPEELYKVTRGVWNVDPEHAANVKYALAVYGGIVREVYEVDSWVPADTIKNWHHFQQEKVRDRYAFNGRVADESIRERYNNKSVEGIWPHGAQNPIKYVHANLSSNTSQVAIKSTKISQKKHRIDAIGVACPKPQYSNRYDDATWKFDTPIIKLEEYDELAFELKDYNGSILYILNLPTQLIEKLLDEEQVVQNDKKKNIRLNFTEKVGKPYLHVRDGNDVPVNKYVQR